MILKYGNYSHDAGEVKLRISRRALESNLGVIYGHTETWNIYDGRKQAADTAALMTALAAMEAAYKIPNQSLVLYQDDGTTITHSLYPNQTMGGLRVLGPTTYPRGDGAEMTTYRYFDITIEADVVLSGGNQTLAWEESIEYEGYGAAEYVYLPTLTGVWPRQRVTDTSTIIITQSGSSVGLRSWIPYPLPVISDPGAVRGKPRQSRRTPRYRNGQRWEFPSSWSYQFEVDSIIPVLPTDPP